MSIFRLLLRTLSLSLAFALYIQPFGASPVAAAEVEIFDAASAGAVVDNADAAMRSGGAPALQSLLPSLEVVLQSALKHPKDEQAVILGSRAGYALGWYYNDTRQHAQALVPLEQAVSLNPNNIDVAAECNQALNGLGRFSDSLSNYDRLLAGTLSALDRARLLRGKGLALTELNRLDEAAAAYEESLRLEPGHKGAEGELEYIRRLRMGGRAAPLIFKTYEKAKAGE